MRPNLIVITSTLVALAGNIALDMFTDIPMLVRWAVAVGLGLLTTLALSKWPKRRPERDTNEVVGRR